MTTAITRDDITAVILAGGKARRMGGEDKGLITLNGRPLVDYLIESLQTQAAHVLINANRNHERYAAFGLPVVADILDDYLGPLAGMASGMQASTTAYIVTAPCDSPLLPEALVERLAQALQAGSADISVAHDGERLQPVFALLRCTLLPDLLEYLESGGRKIDHWYAQHRYTTADFSDAHDAFINMNTPQDRQRLEALLATRV